MTYTIKTYTIKNTQINAEEIRRLVKKNPEILENKGRERVAHGEAYSYLADNGDITVDIERGLKRDKHRFDIGNYLPGNQLDPDYFQSIVWRLLARQRLWDWALENAHFVPDWGDRKQDKWYVWYYYGDNKFKIAFQRNYQFQFDLPYFATKEDCQRFIDECGEDLEIYRRGR